MAEMLRHNTTLETLDMSGDASIGVEGEKALNHHLKTLYFAGKEWVSTMAIDLEATIARAIEATRAIAATNQKCVLS